ARARSRARARGRRAVSAAGESGAGAVVARRSPCSAGHLRSWRLAEPAAAAHYRRRTGLAAMGRARGGDRRRRLSATRDRLVTHNAPQDVVGDPGDVVVVVVGGEAAAPGDRTGRETRTAVRPLEVDDVGADQRLRRPALVRGAHQAFLDHVLVGIAESGRT